MEEKNDIFDHLKPRKTPVPDASYFEALANSVIESQKEKVAESPKETKIIPLYKRPMLWIGSVAAVFIAGILIINFAKTSEEETDPLLALNDISSEEVYKYIDENIEDFDTEMIAETLNETTINNLSVVESDTTKSASTNNNTTAQPISFDEIDADDILEYFNQEGFDLEDLDDDDSFI